MAAIEVERKEPVHSVREGMRSGWFIGLYIWNLAINFGANFGLEYATLTQWGTQDIVRMHVWKMVHVPKSLTYTCLALDVMATGFLVAYFTAWLGPGAAVDAVKKGKLAPIDPSAFDKGVWRFIPMRTKNVCSRAFKLGFEFALTFGVVTVLILYIAMGNSGSIPGIDYCWFKALWATFLATMVYPISHFSAISTDKLPVADEKKALLGDSRA